MTFTIVVTTLCIVVVVVIEIGRGEPSATFPVSPYLTRREVAGGVRRMKIKFFGIYFHWHSEPSLQFVY